MITGFKRNVLVVEDDVDLREAYQGLLNKLGYGVKTAPCIRDAFQLLQTNHFEILLIDFNMPGGNGDELISKVKGMGLSFEKVVLATSLGRNSKEVSAVIKLNPNIVHLEKPFSIKNLRSSISSLS
jgi:DNA-binding NtrC family response regulator